MNIEYRPLRLLEVDSEFDKCCQKNQTVKDVLESIKDLDLENPLKVVVIALCIENGQLRERLLKHEMPKTVSLEPIMGTEELADCRTDLEAEKKRSFTTNENLHEERKRRVYYQTMIYQICNLVDAKIGIPGKYVMCGTIEQPTTQLLDTLKELLK